MTVISATSAHVTWYDTTLGQNQKVLDDRVYTVQYNALSGRCVRCIVTLDLREVFRLYQCFLAINIVWCIGPWILRVRVVPSIPLKFS